MRKHNTITALAIVASASMTNAQPHGHGGDGIVGIDGTGRLALEMDLDEAFPFEEFFSGSGLNGFISDAPGFAALEMDEPDEGFFVLGADADIHWKLIATSRPEMQVYNPFFDIPSMSAGETFAFGAGNAFDTHPFWFLNTDLPSFDPLQSEWSVQFQLVDLGATGYADSDVFEIRFAIPAPASAALFGVAGAACARRRRS